MMHDEGRMCLMLGWYGLERRRGPVADRGLVLGQILLT